MDYMQLFILDFVVIVVFFPFLFFGGIGEVVFVVVLLFDTGDQTHHLAPARQALLPLSYNPGPWSTFSYPLGLCRPKCRVIVFSQNHS